MKFLDVGKRSVASVLALDKQKNDEYLVRWILEHLETTKGEHEQKIFTILFEARTESNKSKSPRSDGEKTVPGSDNAETIWLQRFAATLESSTNAELGLKFFTDLLSRSGKLSLEGHSNDVALNNDTCSSESDEKSILVKYHPIEILLGAFNEEFERCRNYETPDKDKDVSDRILSALAQALAVAGLSPKVAKTDLIKWSRNFMFENSELPLRACHAMLQCFRKIGEPIYIAQDPKFNGGRRLQKNPIVRRSEAFGDRRERTGGEALSYAHLRGAELLVNISHF